MKFVAVPIALAAVALAAPADAGVVNVVGTFATARFTPSAGSAFQSTFLISGALTEFYYAESDAGAFRAFTMDVRASALRFTFDFAGYPFLSFGPGAFLELTFAPLIQVDSLTVGLMGEGVTGVTPVSLARSGNVVGLDLSTLEVSQAGAAFVLNFTASTVPGPASLVGAAALLVGTRRRR
jgi:hypothetical protein